MISISDVCSTVSMEILFEALCFLGSRRKVEVELQVTCLIHVVSYFDCHEFIHLCIYLEKTKTEKKN